jgi:hypothetical protein
MIRTRALAVMASSSILLGTAAGGTPASAISGAHWSPAKCNKTYLTWYKKHTGSNGSVSPKQAKEQTAYIRKLEHQHHCHFAG